MDNKNIIIVNNTGADLGIAHLVIVEAIKGDGQLPAEISDLFTLVVIPQGVADPNGSVSDKIRGIVGWA